MASHLEKYRFSERLGEALEKAGFSPVSPTAVARRFNLLHGSPPVSVQAVRRWLEGSAIPSQDKLIVLATLCRVSPQWLRFGDDPAGERPRRGTAVRENPPVYQGAELAALVELLSHDHRELVSRFVTALLASEGKLPGD